MNNLQKGLYNLSDKKESIDSNTSSDEEHTDALKEKQERRQGHQEIRDSFHSKKATSEQKYSQLDEIEDALEKKFQSVKEEITKYISEINQNYWDASNNLLKAVLPQKNSQETSSGILKEGAPISSLHFQQK